MKDKKILIVDDSSTDRRLMLDALSEGGFASIVAEDGESALRMAREEPLALILLDVVMPGLNGFEVCRKLKADPATAAIKVVLVSSKDQEFDRYWGLRQGADEYLFKPFSDEGLRQVVVQQLGQGADG